MLLFLQRIYWQKRQMHHLCMRCGSPLPSHTDVRWKCSTATLTRRITSRMRAFLAVFFFFLYSSFKPQSSMWEHLILAQSSQANPSQGGARFQTSSFQAHCTPTLIPDGSSASGFYPSALSMFGFIPLFSRWGQEIDTTGKCSSCRVFFILFTFLIWPS